MKDTLYNEFYDPSQQFCMMEPRAFCYDLAEEFIYKAKHTCNEDWYDDPRTVKGVLLLLFTWNFAAQATKKPNIREDIWRLIRDNKEYLKFLEQFSIENAGEHAWPVIGKVFANFTAVLGQTGASKVLSLLNPYLFVMWDTKIRKRLNKELIPGIDNGKRPEHYITFLQGIQRVVRDYHIPEKLPNGSIVAKKIDEYHYVKIVLPGS